MILDGHAPGHVARAADALAAGQLVGLPTETVYGLAAAPTTMSPWPASFRPRAGPPTTR